MKETICQYGQKFGQHTRNMANIPDIWSKYQKYGQHTRNMVNIPEIWSTYQKYSHDDLVQVCYCIQRLKFFPNDLLASTFERGSSSSTDINLIKLSTLSLLQKLQQPAIIRRMPPDLVEVPLQELAPIVSPKTKK